MNSRATFRGWTASSVPIALWAIHITALAALAQPLCSRPELSWLPHVLTVGLTLACVPFLLMSLQLVAATSVDETETPDDLHFLGWLGLAMGLTSVVLIVAEGLIVLGVGPCL